MGLKTQAARFGAGTPELKAVAVSGAGANAKITVTGLGLKDLIVAVLNVTDGKNQTVKTQEAGGIKIEESTEGKKLVVLFWELGRG